MQQDSSDPTGVRDESPRGDHAIVRARERKANAAIQMKIAGAGWDEIAEVLGYPTGRQALLATERALERELRTESKDAMRAMSSKRLDRLLRAVWPKAIDGSSPEQMMAVTKAREIIAQHAKLFGLDAPAEVTVHSPAQQELEQWVASVVQQTRPMLEEADIFDLDDEDIIEVEEEADDAVPAG